jgi:hypothetical protein
MSVALILRGLNLQSLPYNIAALISERKTVVKT